MTNQTKPRRPPGRPTLHGERMRRISVMLTDEYAEQARELGDGSISAGLRLALDRMRTQR